MKLLQSFKILQNLAADLGPVLALLKSKGSKICNRHQFGHFTIGIIEKVKE